MAELSLTGLRVLREVASRGSFTAAAESLGYTQSAVSRQVAGLETAAGIIDGLRDTPLTEIETSVTLGTGAVRLRINDEGAKLTHVHGPIPSKLVAPLPGAARRREDSGRQIVTLMIRVTRRQVLYEVKKL